MEVKKIFATRLKELRCDKNLSIRQLATKVGISANSISRWESQKSTPDIVSLFILSNFFDVETDYLLGIKDY